MRTDSNELYLDPTRAAADASRLRAEEMLRAIHAVSSVVRGLVGRVVVWYKRQRLFEELDSLSDYVLADMGMTRENLRSTVRTSYPYPSFTGAANDDQDQRSLAA